ncbi:cupin domain-containing protein [Alteromonas sp. C1M14]|uniref:cupin domain-containing protein n=1 Tax=Alteromonas sp. C1M14 TaxID=2841567 RepID=UPI001C094C91|nr:cupin domain-containing protein [Alteromonas sp. C1M14]MBU2979279.1 cupin domain-containing protein [Alteromonas sp. C1M14]
MKHIKLDQIKPYNPPAHFGMVAMKVQGEEESGLTKFWQGLSYFLPNGGADMQYQAGAFGAEFEKSYYVIDGELTVVDEKNRAFVLKAGDSIAILPNEGRKLRNETNNTTTVLVTVSTS